MSVIIGKNSFNKVWVASIGKDEFIKHYEKVKGFEDVDLATEYDNIVPPSEKKVEKSK